MADVFSIVDVLIPFTMIMLNLGLGASLTVSDFRGAIKHWQGPLVCMFCQFGLMPAIACLLALILGVTNLQAISMVLIGACPGGAISNLYEYYSNSELSLGILSTVCSTVLAAVLMPPLVWLYSRPFVDVDTQIPIGALVAPVVAVALAVVIGMTIKHFKDNWAKCLERVSAIAGMVFIAVIAIVSMVRDYESLSAGWRLWVAAFAIMPLGGAFGYSITRLVGLPPKSARAVSFETGIQNAPLGIAILVLAFPDSNRRAEASVFPFLYLLFTNIDGILMILFFRYVLPDKECDSMADPPDDTDAVTVGAASAV